MVSIPKIIGVMSCSFVLCLSLSNVTQAADRMGTDPCADRKGSEPNLLKCNEEAQQGIHTIKGEVLRVDGNDYLVKRYDGKEVSMRVDSGTQMSGPIGRGDRIEAKVREGNDERRVLSLRQVEK
jgi:hypothetical protein